MNNIGKKAWILGYKIITAVIILIGRLRDVVEMRVNRGVKMVRFDRTLPWPKDQPKDGLWMTCCDCGLAHFFSMGHSGSPARPQEYDYGLRFGAVGHAKPDPELGVEAHKRFWDFQEKAIDNCGALDLRTTSQGAAIDAAIARGRKG